MTLTHTITQTHRHYRDGDNAISVDEAREHKFPLFAECGTVWIPGSASETANLPMCPQCSARDRQGVTNGVVRPHYVYRCFDAEDRLIYVGVSFSPLRRMEQHSKTSWWFDQMARTTFRVFQNREYAHMKERQAIAEENPRWNIRGRDRGLWTTDDYRDAHYALTVREADEKRLEKLRLEALRRFGVDLAENEEATA